jgi:hypothetical protein
MPACSLDDIANVLIVGSLTSAPLRRRDTPNSLQFDVVFKTDAAAQTFADAGGIDVVYNDETFSVRCNMFVASHMSSHYILL